MATFLFLDDSLVFGPHTVDIQPLGGAESALSWLVQALLKRGHRVIVRNRCESAVLDGGLDWAPLETPVGEPVDLVVANRRWPLLKLFSNGRRPVLWLHNRAEGLRRFSKRLGLLRFRPTLIVTSRYHAGTLPPYLIGTRHRIIPLAPHDLFVDGEPRQGPPPGPKAVFLSNPTRRLDELLDCWERHIRPAVPDAELHLFGGPEVYQMRAARRATVKTHAVLTRAADMAGQGVVINAPVSRAKLVDVLREMRALIYLGEEDETYCLVAAEAQAMGVPIVVADCGCLAERLRPGETGFLVPDGDLPAFAEKAVQVLTDDELWQRQHAAALAHRAQRRWDDVAAEFEALLTQG